MDPMALEAMIEVEELQEFEENFEKLMEAFHNTVLTQGQNVYLTNLSNIQKSYINLHIFYRKANGGSVQIETMGVIDHHYRRTLRVIGHTLWGGHQRSRLRSHPASTGAVPASIFLDKTLLLVTRCRLEMHNRYKGVWCRRYCVLIGKAQLP